MKILPIIVGVAGAVLLVAGHAVKSLNFLNYPGTLLIVLVIVLLAKGLSDRSGV